MKKVVQFLGVLFMFALVACGPTTEDAIKFNDELVTDQKEVLALEDNLITSLVDWEYENAQADLATLSDKVNALLKKYEDMKPFDKEDEFRQSMISLLKAFKEQAETNYTLAIEYIPYSATLDELDEALLEELLDVLDQIDIAVEAANQNFLDTQVKFAEKYKLTLE